MGRQPLCVLPSTSSTDMKLHFLLLLAVAMVIAMAEAAPKRSHQRSRNLPGNGRRRWRRDLGSYFEDTANSAANSASDWGNSAANSASGWGNSAANSASDWSSSAANWFSSTYNDVSSRAANAYDDASRSISNNF